MLKERIIMIQGERFEENYFIKFISISERH